MHIAMKGRFRNTGHLPHNNANGSLNPTGIKAKVENKGQYDEYLRDLKPLREELGVNLKEDLYPDPSSSGTVDAQAS